MGHEWKDKCGVFGVWGDPDSSVLAHTGLYAQQHRGQESAGIAVSDGETLQAHVGMGLVAEVFNERILAELTGKAAIGHNRYSTTGSSRVANAPAFIAPPPSCGSSQCCISTLPVIATYAIALAIIPADATAQPTSVKPTAPLPAIKLISARSVPLRPRVIAPVGNTLA